MSEGRLTAARYPFPGTPDTMTRYDAWLLCECGHSLTDHSSFLHSGCDEEGCPCYRFDAAQTTSHPEKTTMTDTIPRRIDSLRWTPAERAIYDAMQAVEAMPADVRLTDAVILLGKARDRVADFVDGVGNAAPDECARCGKTWSEHQIGYSASRCGFLSAGAVSPRGDTATPDYTEMARAKCQEIESVPAHDLQTMASLVCSAALHIARQGGYVEGQIRDLHRAADFIVAQIGREASRTAEREGLLDIIDLQSSMLREAGRIDANGCYVDAACPLGESAAGEGTRSAFDVSMRYDETTGRVEFDVEQVADDAATREGHNEEYKPSRRGSASP